MATVVSILVSLIIWIILFFTVLPALTLIICYRFLIGKLVLIFNSRIDQIVPRRSAMFVTGKSKFDFHVATMLGIEGQIGIEDLRKMFSAQVLLKVDSNGKWLRPELQQFPVSICGFPFWKWEESFSIEQHVNLLEIDSIWDKQEKSVEEVLGIIETSVLRRTWRKDLSPWELLLVQNVTDTPIYGCGPESAYSGSLLILHFNQVLGDCNTIREICQDLFGYHEDMSTSRNPDVGNEEIKSNKFWPLFNAPYDLRSAYNNIRASNQGYILGRPKAKETFKSNNVGITPTIPLEVIKSITRSQDVSFAAVILTLAIRAYGRFVLTAGYDLPEKLVCACTRAIDSHPSKRMRNHNTLIAVSVPLSSDGAELFKIIEALLVKEKNSVTPKALFHAIGLGGSICNCLKRDPSSRFAGAFTLTNISVYAYIYKRFFVKLNAVDGEGFKSQQRIFFIRLVSSVLLLLSYILYTYVTTLLLCGVQFSEKDIYLNLDTNRLRTVFCLGSVQAGGWGFSFLSTSCKNGIRFVIQIDQSIISKDVLSANEFAQFFLEDLVAWSGKNTN